MYSIMYWFVVFKVVHGPMTSCSKIQKIVQLMIGGTILIQIILVRARGKGNNV